MDRPDAWALGVGLFALITAGAAAPTPTEPPADLVPAITAEVEQTVLAPDGRPVFETTFTLLLADARARVEYGGAPGRSSYAEYQVYDFDRKRLYRVFPDDRIYFEAILSPPLASKAHREGWAPLPAQVTVRTIPLKPDPIGAARADLALVERRRGRALEYALVWTAVPPGRLPARVIYREDGGQTVVLAYRRVESRTVESSAFAVPDGFVNLSAF
jgi:hypothetical protein